MPLAGLNSYGKCFIHFLCTVLQYVWEVKIDAAYLIRSGFSIPQRVSCFSEHWNNWPLKEIYNIFIADIDGTKSDHLELHDMAPEGQFLTLPPKIEQMRSDTELSWWPTSEREPSGTTIDFDSHLQVTHTGTNGDLEMCSQCGCSTISQFRTSCWVDDINHILKSSICAES